MNNLVIVESPTKARTLERFLGKDFWIVASMGHIRDLPKSELGVDVDHNFEPKYIIPRDKRKRANELRKMASKAKTLWLATDPDREGEAIAWHIAELLRNSEGKSQKAKVKSSQEIQRVEFHEITEDAIKEAFKHPREIDEKLVDAQQARRVLDRLVGYKLSPLLWAKVKRGLSAGRVQSVALRLIVEREREIEAFKPVEYWSIEAELEANYGGETPKGVSPLKRFIATLVEQNGKKLEIHNKQEADTHLANLEKSDYCVSKINKKEVRRYPAPPFTTSTLQQTVSNRLGFSAKRTMMLAQNLYERGLITYMRTDSVHLALTAVSAVRSFIQQEMGKNYLPSTTRFFKSKSKNAQEAHEAIRPTNVSLQPSAISNQNGLTRDHARLYDLIWKRFVSCQMSEAVLDQTTVDVEASHRGPTPEGVRPLYLLRATGSIVKFDGWMKIYEKLDGGKWKMAEEDGSSKVDSQASGEEKRLPELSENELLNLLALLPNRHFTEPPPRYNEASLIKKLEELGIGRPSTYAPILSTIQERFYTERLERRFNPTALGMAVNDFVVKYFPDIVDYQFTARMEDELDDVSRGERDWRPTIKEFYSPFEKKVEETSGQAERVKLEVEYAGKKCPECGKELVIRAGRFGKFLACSGFPDCKHTEALERKLDIKCPLDGGEVVVRRTKRGKTFYGCKNWPVCKFASWTKPKEKTED